MAEEQPATVFVAESLRVADTVVRFLSEVGIPAEIVTPPPPTESQPITGMTEASGPEVFEVRVTDAGKVAAARELLESTAAALAVQAARQKRASRSGVVTATCEECGKSSDWPATAMGTTEYCPHCGAYMDIPDPDDDWSDVDIGKPDE